MLKKPVCELVLLRPVVPGVGGGRKDIKGKTGDPDAWIQSLRIPGPPRGPSPWTLLLEKAIVLRAGL